MIRLADWSKIAERITEFIRRFVESAGAQGVIVGISGGVDSVTTAFLCVRALGRDRVLGLIMPEKGVTRDEDIRDAIDVCRKLNIEYRYIEINEIVESFLRNLDKGDMIPVANLKPRIRMTINYYYANLLNYVVAGTGNKSEIACGYFTKWGDGAADFFPIGDLYKTEVFELARFLGVPERIIDKKPSSGLWVGQTDEEELGISYERLDGILKALERGMSSDEIVEKLRFDRREVERVLDLMERSRHKRELPPIIRLRDLLD